jgi:hypothetical protein
MVSLDIVREALRGVAAGPPPEDADEDIPAASAAVCDLFFLDNNCLVPERM